MSKELLGGILLVAILVGIVFAMLPVKRGDYQFACLDSAGQPAMISPKIKNYWYTANSVRGEDDKGTQYFYTLPQGWLCIISEVK